MLYTFKKDMSTIFYVKDTTLPEQKLVKFQTYVGLVDYLENMSKRKYNQSKTERARLLEEIGYGADDRYSTLFVRSMQEEFEIGVARDGCLIQCDVPSLVAYQKPEYGD